MIFSLDIRRAGKGDCLLLHYGPKKDPGLAIIDGGPAGIYGAHLRPRLLEIKRARRLGKGKPLPVDLLMVSHVDDDHVQGILDLTRELIETEDARQPPLLRVMDLWHNSFDAVVEDGEGDLAKAFGGHSEAASLAGKKPDEGLLDDFDWSDEEEEEVALSSFKVLAGLAQGFRLRNDAEKLGIEINPEFRGELILAGEDASAPLEFDRGLAFTVVGPMKPELEALRKKHAAWLKELKAKGKSPSAALAAYVDRSVANLSSLVVIAELGGKRMLLTGDARGDKIIQGLQMSGRIGAGGASAMHVDVLKVPHHGSARNLETDFFERITADHYVFSGDGEHGNPEREALEMLFDARGDAPFTIHLTYPVPKIDELRKKDWEEQQRRERARAEKAKTTAAKKVDVRPDWSPEKHGLEAFFRQRKLAPGQEVKVVEEDRPHLIDLLAPI
jgi:hypothetical protein